MEAIPNFEKESLLPAVVQDAASGEVLMVAYMNEQAYRLTLESGLAHFWSRSRKALWQKGETSGNRMVVVEVRLDCDQDAILVRVQPDGPACHTGQRSCFFRQALNIGSAAERFSIRRLSDLIEARRDAPKEGSYTSSLFEQGEDEMLKKVGEEAVEVILAAKGQGDQRLVEELADLTFHALVVLAARRLEPEAVLEELRKRHK
jgi:phosphoribosyl-AMP cyclohydrolase / phosphoribosyl-ATP pyrophosphohydrolase